MSLKFSGPDGDHGRKPDRGVHRVAATNPVPELEHIRGVNPEGFADLPPRCVETATKCFATAASLPPSARQAPGARGARHSSSSQCVVKVLEETMNSVSAGSRSRVASKKSVPSMFETKRKVRLARSL